MISKKNIAHRKHKIAGAVTVALLTTGLTGCGTGIAYTEAYGTVEDKSAWQTTDMMPIGKTWMPVTTDHYGLSVKYKDEEFPSGSFQEVWKVNASVYSSCEVNDYIHRETNGDLICSKESFN